jgi:hypothetical protein
MAPNNSSKLDQSLDQIMTDARTSRPRRSNRRAPAGGVKARAPVGGVKKNTKEPKKAPAKAATPSAPIKSGEGKVLVSNLVSTSALSNVTQLLICCSQRTSAKSRFA